jgi:hypothetical protein
LKLFSFRNSNRLFFVALYPILQIENGNSSNSVAVTAVPGDAVATTVLNRFDL